MAASASAPRIWRRSSNRYLSGRESTSYDPKPGTRHHDRRGSCRRGRQPLDPGGTVRRRRIDARQVPGAASAEACPRPEEHHPPAGSNDGGDEESVRVLPPGRAEARVPRAWPVTKDLYLHVDVDGRARPDTRGRGDDLEEPR